jgi:hypothetical protein
MGMIAREDLLKWIKKQTDKGNWLQVNDTATPKGRVVIYVTYAGQFVAVQYDIDGKVMQVGQPVVMPAPQSPLGFKSR